MSGLLQSVKEVRTEILLDDASADGRDYPAAGSRTLSYEVLIRGKGTAARLQSRLCMRQTFTSKETVLQLYSRTSSACSSPKKSNCFWDERTTSPQGSPHWAPPQWAIMRTGSGGCRLTLRRAALNHGAAPGSNRLSPFCISNLNWTYQKNGRVGTHLQGRLPLCCRNSDGFLFGQQTIDLNWTKLERKHFSLSQILSTNLFKSVTLS